MWVNDEASQLHNECRIEKHYIGEIGQFIENIFDTEIQVVEVTEYVSFKNIFPKTSYHL